MYHTIVKRLARKNFELVSQKDFEALLKDCVPDIHHRFGGQHALGGERHDKEALRRWFGRLGRLGANLKLTVNDVWVKGWPHNTTIITRWSATDTYPDGSPYTNRGVHIVKMRWGKITDIDAHEDSEAVAGMLRRRAEAGDKEGLAPQIVS
jgi:ketosteroid isomerase-like protein